MTLLLLACGLGLLAVPALARPLSRRLPPSEWAKACAGLLATGWVVVEASLLLQAAPTLLRVAGLESLAELCEHALGPVAPGGPLLGVAAAGAAIAVALLAARSVMGTRHQQRALRVEPGIGWHATVGGHELVVLPSGNPVAFSTGGRPGQVVLSDGLVAALSDPELAAVLRHEAAHVQHRHQRYLLLARTVERSLGLLPPVAGATGALRCAVERWADEEAAGGDATGRASVHAALLRLAELAATPEVAAVTTPGTVAERLDALQAEPPPARPWAQGAGVRAGRAAAGGRGGDAGRHPGAGERPARADGALPAPLTTTLAPATTTRQPTRCRDGPSGGDG